MGFPQEYERPYTKRQMLAAGYAPALVRKLMADPVHAWRARTGVELIHKEPDLKEAIRVWVNWNRMSAADKARSDRKSKRLFGVDNKTHYEQLRPTYATKKAALVTAVPLISAIIRSIRADPGSPDRTINLPEVLREMVHLDRAVDQSKVASAAGWRPSDALAVRRMPPARTAYVSAARPRPPAPRHTLRPWDAGAKFRPPPWSAEARLHQAGETAIGGLATGMSAPLSATLGGLHGVTNGVRSGNGAVGTALQGLVGAGTAFIPGRVGVANTAGGGGIEGIAGDIISGKM